ncbi:MAG: ADOP family duplicated permease [Terriglobia bacterium]
MTLRREFSKIRTLFRRRKPADDLAEEIRGHLAMEEQENLESGMAPEEAHYAALRRFGNVTLAQERSREMWGWNSLETLGQDLRFGLRMLAKDTGFAGVAVLTLALGVGANTAVFSVVKAVLLDPLPYADAGHLITIAEAATDDPDNHTLDYTTARELQERSHSFEGISAYRDGPGVLVEDGKPEVLRGLSIDRNFFDTLGVRMELGRTFVPLEQQPNQCTALILSHGLWVRRFGADPHILGRVLRLNGYAVTVVGVLPAEFKPLLKATSELDPETYSALSFDPFARCHNCQSVNLLGRLKRGVNIDEARAELNALLQPIVRQTPAAHLRGARLNLVPLPDQLLGRASTAVWVVWCAAAFILLMACANVANLLLERATGRAREIALRTALGAGRGRLLRQLLTESLVLACAGGLAGIALAFCATHALASFVPAKIPRAQTAHVDAAVLAYALAATVIAALVFGLAPAWRATHIDLSWAIKGVNGRGRTHRSLRNALAAAEIAMALALAVGAGLMGRTFWRLMTVGAGFDPHNVLTLTTSVFGPRYAGNRIGYYRDVLEQLRTIPGIKDVAVTSLIPMDYTDRAQIHRADRPLFNEDDAPFADLFSVSTDYFRVMRIPLRYGRVFTDQDTASTGRVALINESCARTLFAGENPMGRHIKLGPGNALASSRAGTPWMTIVGVVGDVRQDGIDQPADMQVYSALNQEAIIGYYRLVARTTNEPMLLEHAVRNAFAAVDAGSPVYHVKPLEAYVSGKLADRTFALALLALFGTLSLALAAVGIYGVVSYAVTQRTREVGIRMALGARRGEVLRRLVGEGLLLTLAGLGVGWVAALALARVMASMLYGVTPSDPATFLTVSVLLAGVAFLASYIPARRATKVDPMVALRYE